MITLEPVKTRKIRVIDWCGFAGVTRGSIFVTEDTAAQEKKSGTRTSNG